MRPAPPLRILFAGTPDFAVPPLQALVSAGFTPAAVYTQPDRPAGRGRQLQASPVKQAATEAGIEVHQPASLRAAEAVERLRAFSPDLMVVVAYGLILPPEVLSVPTHGCWNIHASLLPRWRGAAPIQRAIEAGDTAAMATHSEALEAAMKEIADAKGVSITFIKHSTLLIKDVDRVLLVDPVFDDIFWFIKDFSPRAFSLDDMPRPDHVLITHGHLDHYGAAAEIREWCGAPVAAFNRLSDKPIRSHAAVKKPRVVVVFDDRIVMRDTLDEAMAAVFEGLGKRIERTLRNGKRGLAERVADARERYGDLLS